MKNHKLLNILIMLALGISIFGMPEKGVSAQTLTTIRVSNNQIFSTYTTRIRYVTLEGTGDCSSWANACALQSALTSAVAGDEIWVAAGRYTPTTGTDRTATFQIKDGVSLYGGFAGTETARDQRDPAANLTILSGDLNDNDADGFVNYGENSYHVVTVLNSSASTILDGFTITGGNATEYRDPIHAFGGGLYISSSSPTLSNLIVKGNVANYGAGMFIGNFSTPKLTNITINNNLAGGGFGGGVMNYNGGNPTFTNVTFSGNSAGTYGGGIYNFYANNLTLINVTLIGNSAVGGGAIDGGSPMIYNTIIWGNTAGGTTGADAQFRETMPTIFDSVLQGGCPAGGTCTNSITANPMVGTLGNYGGFSPTFPLLEGSSAIDAGNDTTCAAIDQRGILRPQGLHCDIGAFEFIRINASPVISEGNSTEVIMSMNSSPTPFALTLHATDTDGDTLTWSLASPASHGAASASGLGESMSVGYTPEMDYVGADSFSVQVEDGHGGTDTIIVNVTIEGDTTPPGIVWSGDISDGASFIYGSVPAAPTCSAVDFGSGPASCAVTGYGITTGSHTLTATAYDMAGNSYSESHIYTVLPWRLSGFFQPVDMGNIWNTVKNGSTVPLKFRIFAGTTELTDLSAIKSLGYKVVACTILPGAPEDAIETLAPAGGTVLRYSDGQFIYNWKTPSATGQCYQVTMTAQDGSPLVAYFKLK